MLQRLVLDRSSEQHEHIVLSMINLGPVGEALQRQGIRVETLGMHQGVVSVVALFRLVRMVRSIEPQVIVGWMYHGALASLLATMVCGSVSGVVWNIRHSLESLDAEVFKTRMILKLLRRFSAVPKRIVFNSHRSLQQHHEFGFVVQDALVIPNGFDSEEFFPDEEAYRDVRVALGVPEGSFVVGHVARYHWVKGYESFLEVVQRVTEQLPHVVFVWIGREASPDNQALQKVMPVLTSASQLMLLGERQDVARLYRSFDTLLLSSLSEGFPNVLGEAMLSGVHCVTTDVGDAAHIVDSLGDCCAVGDVEAMTASIVRAVENLSNKQQRVGHGVQCRARIASLFSMQAVAEQYRDVYQIAYQAAE